MSSLPSEAARSCMTAEGGGRWTPGMVTQQSTSGIKSTPKSAMYHSSIPDKLFSLQVCTQSSAAECSLFRDEQGWYVQSMGMAGTFCPVKSIPFILQKPSSHSNGATALITYDQTNARPRVHEANSHHCVDAQAGTGL